MTRVPAVPVKFTTVPSVAAPTVIGCPGPLCCTRPIVPPLIWVCRLARLVLVLNNWLPFTASVLAAESVPGATLTILRSLPTAPTDTVFG